MQPYPSTHRPHAGSAYFDLIAMDAGAEVAAHGQNLSKEFVASVYLTKGDDTFELTLTSQTDEKITAKLPANLKSGRYGLMVLTRGDVPRLIEQPVFLILE